MKRRKLKGAQRRLASRIREWENLSEGKSDISRKGGQNAFRKPGSLQGHN